MTDSRTPIARAHGLGAAGGAARHWMVHKLTAIASFFLVLWFVVSMATLAGSDFLIYRAWVENPVVTVLLIALIANMFYHLSLGLTSITDDYVHARRIRFVSQLLIKGGSFFLALLGIVSVFQVSLGS